MTERDPSTLDAGLRVAAVVLAAGGSRRFGRPKQLLIWKGVPLVRRAVLAALDSGADDVIVVLGAERKAVGAALARLPIDLCVNPDWAEGIGTSVSAGVRHALARPGPCEAVLLCLADQPRCDAGLLRQLVRAGRAGRRRVACGYRGTRGAPALFADPDDLARLSTLDGDRGAQSLLAEGDTHTIPCEPAADDVDTPDDWARLRPHGPTPDRLGP